MGLLSHSPIHVQHLKVASLVYSCLVLVCFSFSFLLMQVSSLQRVAGMARATAARHLAQAGLEVTVVECGNGVGGRMSPRRINVHSNEDHREGAAAAQAQKTLSFDHGAQYIGTPNQKPRQFQNGKKPAL